MNLSPRQLRIFVYLAQTLSFSRTADHFCVSQPTLSKLVKEIEESVGVRLFERTTRTVRLTDDGDAMVGVARRVVENFDGGMTELAQVRRHRSHGLSIAAMPTLAATLLPELVAELQRDVPDAIVRIHDVVTDEALELLRGRRVDLALTTIDVMHKDLAYTELFREPFVLLSRKEYVPPITEWSEAGIDAIPIISMPRGTGTRQLIEMAFVRQGARFRPLLELRDLNSIVRFVAAGCGVALLPRSAGVLLLTPELTLHPIRGAPERTVGIMTRREVELPVLASRMMRSIRERASLLERMQAATE
jgi:LysR family transcriptional regulator, carnitine catabolism transcriptional activator